MGDLPVEELAIEAWQTALLLLDESGSEALRELFPQQSFLWATND